MAESTSESAYSLALSLLDEAHSQDPNTATVGGKNVPYELHYAEKMTKYLEKRAPSASDVLKLAIRAQHLRRWEVPRSNYPLTRAGYYSWRTGLKKRQAQQAKEICIQAGVKVEDADRVAALVNKEGLNKGDEESQILEDVACLVFLDDQFEDFKDGYDEEKIINILKKTWGKMSEEGHQLALAIPLSAEGKSLIAKALQS
jgi:hypothetical protein